MVLSTHNYIDGSGILPSYTHISFIIRCPELETKTDTNKGKSFETLTWLHLEIILIYYSNNRGCEISVRISASMAKKKAFRGVQIHPLDSDFFLIENLMTPGRKL